MWIYIYSTERCAPPGWGDLGGEVPVVGADPVHDLERFRQLFGEKPLCVEMS